MVFFRQFYKFKVTIICNYGKNLIIYQNLNINITLLILRIKNKFFDYFGIENLNLNKN